MASRSMTPARLTLVMLVAVGALVAFYVGKKIFAKTEAPQEVARSMVPMALADLEPGTVITAAHLGTGPVYSEKLTRDMLMNADKIIGRVVKEKITAAQPISANSLYTPNQYPPLDVEPGMRAMAVDVGDSVALVDGLIKPGEFVDVHLVPEEVNDPRIEGGISITLLKGIRVIAINRSFVQSGVGQSLSNTVTLELSPRQANIVSLARQRGLLTLSHNPEGRQSPVSTEDVDPDKVTLDQILNLPPVPAPVEPPQPAPPFQTEVFRQGARGVTYFKDGRQFDDPNLDNSVPAPAPTTSQPNPNSNPVLTLPTTARQ